MVVVREYGIPGLGYFMIRHFRKEIEVDKGTNVKPRFYGTNGGVSPIGPCSDVGEAEVALTKAISKKVQEERDILNQRKETLDNLAEGLPNGISQYISFDESQ